MQRIFKEVVSQQIDLNKAKRDMISGLVKMEQIPNEGGKKMKRAMSKKMQQIDMGGGKSIIIDAMTVERENNRAEKQCQDNN